MSILWDAYSNLFTYSSLNLRNNLINYSNPSNMNTLEKCNPVSQFVYYIFNLPNIFKIWQYLQPSYKTYQSRRMLSYLDGPKLFKLSNLKLSLSLSCVLKTK